MTPLVVYGTRDPRGFVIARPLDGGGVHYWNPGDVWGPSGHLFTDKKRLAQQLVKLLPAGPRGRRAGRSP
jgi:hypothetical protein